MSSSAINKKPSKFTENWKTDSKFTLFSKIDSKFIVILYSKISSSNLEFGKKLNKLSPFKVMGSIVASSFDQVIQVGNSSERFFLLS